VHGFRSRAFTDSRPPPPSLGQALPPPQTNMGSHREKNIIIYRKAEQARGVGEWMKRWPQLTAMAVYLLILPGDVPDPPAQVLQVVRSSAPGYCASPPPAQKPVRHMFSSEEGKDRAAGEQWARAGQRRPRPWLGDRRPVWLGKRHPAAGR
jgi:hypothetical protein